VKENRRAQRREIYDLRFMVYDLFGFAAWKIVNRTS
jgi:hypothetical protein